MTFKLACNQCEMVSINGRACHESGCPNRNSRFDADTGEWVKQYECRECGNMVDIDTPCCTNEEDSQEVEEIPERMKTPTASQLKARYEELRPNGHFFTSKTMRFFGDTMRNFGVCDTETPNEFRIFRRKPVKNGLMGHGWRFNWDTGVMGIYVNRS